MKDYLSKLLEDFAQRLIALLLDRLSNPIDYMEKKLQDWGKGTEAGTEEDSE